MVDHKQVLNSLSQDIRVELTRKSDRRGLMALALHWGAILVLGTAITMRVPFWQFLMLPQGILLVFLFTALHETIHRTAFESLRLNDWVARINGFLIILPSTWFRYFHFAHHRHTQDPQNDPELASPKPNSMGQYVWHVSGIPVWFQQLAALVRNASGKCGDAFVPDGAKGNIKQEAMIHPCLYAGILAISLAARTDILLFIWIIPLLIGQPFLRLYLLAEHGRCPFVANMLENSRTTYTTRLVRQLAWNMPYHAEHHTYPTVPFHQLPRLHTLIRSHLRETENGYIAFNREYVTSLPTNNDDPAG